jgi:hypothetical protein
MSRAIKNPPEFRQITNASDKYLSTGTETDKTWRTQIGSDKFEVSPAGMSQRMNNQEV